MLKKFVLFIMIIILFHLVYFIVDGFWDNTEKADLAVVFGNKVNRDGTLSERLKARLDRSIELYKNDLVKFIIVSGGLGKEGHHESIVMKKYLLEKGILENVVIVDKEGDNSWKTIVNCKRIMEEKGFRKVYLVSQYYHITRVKMAMNKLDVRALTASPFYFEWRDIFSLFREIPAFYKYLIYY